MRGGAALTGAMPSRATRDAAAASSAARRVFAALKTPVAWLYGRGLCRRARMPHPFAMDPGLVDLGMSSTPQPDSMVLLDDVHLTLASDAGAVNVLRGISLAVAPGETVSVVGPSGSGKSTMMMIVGGLERPSAGRVVIAGTELG